MGSVMVNCPIVFTTACVSIALPKNYSGSAFDFFAPKKFPAAVANRPQQGWLWPERFQLPFHMSR
jgi:hypothetical protein